MEFTVKLTSKLKVCDGKDASNSYIGLVSDKSSLAQGSVVSERESLLWGVGLVVAGEYCRIAQPFGCLDGSVHCPSLR